MSAWSPFEKQYVQMNRSPGYEPPVEEQLFVLFDVLAADQTADAPLDKEAVRQVLNAAAALAAEVISPTNRVGDRIGCHLSAEGGVQTPPGFNAAYKALVAGGWPGLSASSTFGGQGLPRVLQYAVSELLSSANMALFTYSALTFGAYAAIEAAGTEAQKAEYLPKLASGAWTGTMNLTEPQCGSDLSLIATRAVPADDGSFRLYGEKQWISGGDHDLSDNIVHLVLARIDGAPEGLAGLSLFVTPKHLPGKGAEVGQRNALICTSLESKMGIHGSSTCLLSHQGSVGWLLGYRNQGLAPILTMMNEARRGVGLQALGQAEAAYQAASAFAQSRRQGRAAGGAKDPQHAADLIVFHPDVRRMLMSARVVIEGCRTMLFWSAQLADAAAVGRTPAERRVPQAILDLITPVLKSFIADQCSAVCSDMLQVHGGAGYTEAYPASQYLRDCRVTSIYEGSNGIQAWDLVGRKVVANGGRSIGLLFEHIDKSLISLAAGGLEAARLATLAHARQSLDVATRAMLASAAAAPEAAAAIASDYLQLSGWTLLALSWAQIEAAARLAVDNPGSAGKLVLALHFEARFGPEIDACMSRIARSAEAVLRMPVDAL